MAPNSHCSSDGQYSEKSDLGSQATGSSKTKNSEINRSENLSLFLFVMPLWGLFSGASVVLVWWALSQHLDSGSNFLPMIPLLLFVWYVVAGSGVVESIDVMAGGNEQQQSRLRPPNKHPWAAFLLIFRFSLLVFLLEQNQWLWLLIAPFVSRALVTSQLFWREFEGVEQRKLNSKVLSKWQGVALIWTSMASLVVTMCFGWHGILVIFSALLAVGLLFRAKKINQDRLLVESELIELIILLSIPF